MKISLSKINQELSSNSHIVYESSPDTFNNILKYQIIETFKEQYKNISSVMQLCEYLQALISYAELYGKYIRITINDILTVGTKNIMNCTKRITYNLGKYSINLDSNSTELGEYIIKIFMSTMQMAGYTDFKTILLNKLNKFIIHQITPNDFGKNGLIAYTLECPDGSYVENINHELANTLYINYEFYNINYFDSIFRLKYYSVKIDKDYISGKLVLEKSYNVDYLIDELRSNFSNIIINGTDSNMYLQTIEDYINKCNPNDDASKRETISWFQKIKEKFINKNI